MKKETTKKPKAVKAEITPQQEKQEIKVIERIIESKEIAPADAFGKMSREQINLLKTTIAKGASDDELNLFIQVCKGANLNPFMKQVFLIPRWDNKTGKEIRAIQVSIDGQRAIAEESGQYAGNDDPIFEGETVITYGDKPAKELTVPNKATVTVYKIVDGGRYGFTATARWTEYYPGAKMGFQWHTRPYLMLGKCAEALALRKAFPKLLSGMYTPEEMDNVQSGPEAEANKRQKGFETLMKFVDKASAKELIEYKKKLEQSDKYTDEQKAQFNRAVDKRIITLETPEQN